MEYVVIDNKKYDIIKEITIDATTYVYLQQQTNDDGFLIQKIKKENNQDMLVNLDSLEEFQMALKEFQKEKK